MQDFIQAIADEHVYLFDGAMGTMLYSKGVFINKCYDELNLRTPEIVLEVHKQYVRAGAEILVERVRKRISARKVKPDDWLGVMREARNSPVALVQASSLHPAAISGPLAQAPPRM